MKNNITPGPWLRQAYFPDSLKFRCAIAALPELVQALRAVVAALNKPVQFTPHTAADAISSLLGCIDVLRGDARFAVNEARSALARAGIE